jgi:DNA-binding MarR family transcriptional regulator
MGVRGVMRHLGLVARIPSPHDRRSAHIRVTARGRQLSRVIEKQVRADVAKLVAVLSRSDRDRFASVLTHIVTTAIDQVSAARPLD